MPMLIWLAIHNFGFFYFGFLILVWLSLMHDNNIHFCSYLTEEQALQEVPLDPPAPMEVAPVPVDVVQALEFLETAQEVNDNVKRLWGLTTLQRKQFSVSIHGYYEKYPCLKHRLGFELVRTFPYHH